MNLSRNTTSPKLYLNNDSYAASSRATEPIVAARQSKNASFRYFPRGHQDFVLRTASTRFLAR